jgi:two-component system, chemotaxis family, sensor kinase Cph1
MSDAVAGLLAETFDPAALNACDLEPIHIPGSIQPYGLLLVADADDVLVGGAGDLEGRLRPGWLGASLKELLGAETLAMLKRGEAVTGVGPAQAFDATAHKVGDLNLVELEPADPQRMTSSQLLSKLNVAAAGFERAAGLDELCERAADAFQAITGFARVMVYRFIDEGAGVVMAEASADGETAFLNHHFPASDVPKQARALYIRNRVRIIHDVAYAPAPLRSATGLLRELDLSDANLRSVSPVHIQYLKNMGVGASCSISIVKDGLLWGLIACHHPSPRLLPYDLRMACQSLAGGLARQIRAKEDADLYRERIRVRASEDIVLAKLSDAEALDDLFNDAGGELCRMMGADGFAASRGDQLYAVGAAPPAEALAELAAWASPLAAVQPLATETLSQQHPAIAPHQALACGLLAARVECEPPILLMWLRAETLEVVKWAGDPHKGAPHVPGAILTPRASFESWSETVRGRSRPWTAVDSEAAARVASALLQITQFQRVRALNRELNATNAANERLLQQKDLLMKEVSHRVQNSLQLVSAFLAMQARGANDEALTAQLEEARNRISAVALVHRRLYADERVENVDLARYLEDLIRELTESMDEGWRARIVTDLAPILISADRAINIGLVVTELVINANKYAYGGRPGPVSVSLEQHRKAFRLVVADKGVGRQGAGEGFGSKVLQAMVGALGGEIEQAENGPGLRVILSAPIAP